MMSIWNIKVQSYIKARDHWLSKSYKDQEGRILKILNFPAIVKYLEYGNFDNFDAVCGFSISNYVLKHNIHMNKRHAVKIVEILCNVSDEYKQYYMFHYAL